MDFLVVLACPIKKRQATLLAGLSLLTSQLKTVTKCRIQNLGGIVHVSPLYSNVDLASPNNSILIPSGGEDFKMPDVQGNVRRPLGSCPEMWSKTTTAL